MEKFFDYFLVAICVLGMLLLVMSTFMMGYVFYTREIMQ